MTTDTTILHCLTDTIVLLKERALSARHEELQDKSDLFKMGIAYGYYEVFLKLVNQAKVFGIPLKALGLDGFDPDRDLMGLVARRVRTKKKRDNHSSHHNE